MTVVAITPRLLLRHWDLTDAGSTEHIYGDPEAMRYFGAGEIFSPTDLTASFRHVIEEYATIGYGNYAVVERATSKILGHCGARYVREKDRVEADSALDRQSWGRGYATEAAQAVFARSFSIDAVVRIVAVAHRDNAASIAVMRRLGMQFCEELTAHRVPSVLYAVERDAFQLSPAVMASIHFPARRAQI
jgi:ribosomal-protein-alanine N-acetyltransferase